MEDRRNTTKEPDSASIEINDSIGHTSATASTLSEDLFAKQEREHKEFMRSCRRRRESKWENIMSPNAYSSSSNTRQILPAKDSFQHSGTFEKPTVATPSIGHTSATAFTLKEDLLVKHERGHKEFMRSCRWESKWDILPPNAYPSPPNTRQILPAKDSFQHSGTFEEPTIVPVGRHVNSALPLQNSNRGTDLPMTTLRNYLYLIRLYEYLYLFRLRDYMYLTRLREEYSERRRQLFGQTVMKADQSLKEPNYHPLYSTVKTPPRAVDEMTHHLKPQECDRVNKYRVKRYTQSKQNSIKNIESQVRPRSDQVPWRKQIKHMGNQNGLRRREPRNEGILATNNDPSSPNTTNILPIKDSFQNLTIEESTADLHRSQVKSYALPTRDSSREWSQQSSDKELYPARLRDSWPEDRLKFSEGQFFRRTVMNRDESIEDYNNHPLHSTIRKSLRTLGARPYHFTPRDPTEIINGYQVRKGTPSERNSSKNVGSGVIPRISENPGGKQIKYKGNQHSLRNKKTISGENALDDNDNTSASKLSLIPTASNGKQHCMIFEESNAVIDARQMTIRSSSVQDSSTVVEDNFRPRVHEDHPEEQEMNFGGDQCHRYRYGQVESILNWNVSPIVKNNLPTRVTKFQETPAIIDESQLSCTMRMQDSNRGAKTEESSEELRMGTNGSWLKKYQSTLSSWIENIYQYLCFNEITIGFVIFCVLLLTILYLLEMFSC